MRLGATIGLFYSSLLLSHCYLVAINSGLENALNNVESYSVLKLIAGIHIEVTAMKYYSRRLVKPEHLNPANTLFGGQLLSWIDEEAAIFAACQMKSTSHVTKLISEINFMTPAHQGDVIEFGLALVSLGHSSITVSCHVRNKMTQAPVVSIDKMVFVHVNAQGLPVPHGIRANAA